MNRVFLRALLVAAALNVSACATAAMSGAANGDRDYPTATEDARIVRDVRTALYRDPLLSDERIRIDVAQGMVTLTGTVDNRMHVDRAVQLARDIEGVRGVKVELGVAGRP